jgi:predicted dehydrogenase
MDPIDKLPISRRKFVKATSAAGLGLLTVRPVMARVLGNDPARKRYVIVGTGSRSRMYQGAIQRDYTQYAELVGLCDTNRGRLELAQKRSITDTGSAPPAYSAAEFDRMINETKPDMVIVTTIDGFHHQYIIRAMELGCDVITEKPLTNTAEKCQQIIDAQKKTGKHCRVTFNYRYSPPRTQVKDLLMKDSIGDILSVDFHWMLNTFHGTDYFRRWHSEKKFSGGLMVHKASHHFDLVNWWLSAVPVTVHATGKREFYTPDMAKRFGLEKFHERCHTCPEKQKCGFELDISADRNLKSLYLDNEKYDGYFRDRCVFRPDIDIEDTMNVLVTYDNQVTMAYSLNAFNAWEGYYIIFNGTRGRLEHRVVEKIYVNGTDTVQGGIKEGGIETRIIPLRGAAYTVDVWTGEGGHGGGDKILLDDLFLPDREPDKYLRASDQRGGAWSVLTGIAANRCFETGDPVWTKDLVQNIGYPDYPAMPDHKARLPMPAKEI